MRHIRLAASAALLCTWLPVHAQEETNPAAALEAPSVEVVGTTPLPGIGTPVNQVPTNVQAITGQTIEEQQNVSLPEALDKNIGSVSITNGQANPFMPDVSFRGFQGSPLLGVPQGISVFVDGVRVNSSFGDTVNWDLIQDELRIDAQSDTGLQSRVRPEHAGRGAVDQHQERQELSGRKRHAAGGIVRFLPGHRRLRRQVRAVGLLRLRVPTCTATAGGIFPPVGSSRSSAKSGTRPADFDADLSYTFANNNLQGTQTVAAVPARRRSGARLHLSRHHQQPPQRLQPAALEGAGDRQDPRRQRVLPLRSARTTSAAT